MGNAFQQAARRAARKNLPFEIARVLVRFDHVVRVIVNANLRIMRPAEKVRITNSIIRFGVPKSAEWENIGNKIKAAFVAPRAYFVNVHQLRPRKPAFQPPSAFCLVLILRCRAPREIQAACKAQPYKLRSNSATCLKHLLSTPIPPKQMLTSFSKPEESQPWTMEYVARLFLEGGGFQGIANTHNGALKRAKAETEAASDLVLNSHGGIRPRKPELMHVPIHSADIAA
jgi:hypothetical protein